MDNILNLFSATFATSHNSDLTLRFGTSPRSVSDTFLSGTPLASASFVPVPNVPSGTQGRGTSLSLVRYASYLKNAGKL